MFNYKNLLPMNNLSHKLMHLKNFVIALLFMLNSIPLQAQNLIQNGDFEMGSDTSTVELLYYLDSLCQVEDGRAHV